MHILCKVCSLCFKDAPSGMFVVTCWPTLLETPLAFVVMETHGDGTACREASIPLPLATTTDVFGRREEETSP